MSQESDPYSEFHSHETGKSFQHCICCGLVLNDPESPYLVAKSFNRGECIFEYAICEDCRSNMSEEFSEDSRANLAAFFENRVNIKQRSMLLAFGPNPEPWLARCAACQKPREEMESYSIGGLLLGSEMLFDPYPLCLCGECEEEIQELLSKKTRGIWDDFVETHFEGPPANVLDLPVRGGKPMVF